MIDDLCSIQEQSIFDGRSILVDIASWVTQCICGPISKIIIPLPNDSFIIEMVNIELGESQLSNRVRSDESNTQTNIGDLANASAFLVAHIQEETHKST